MKIVKCEPNDDEKLFCPSTGEVIFGPEIEEINVTAEAFVAYWHYEVIGEPVINNEDLRIAWDDYYGKYLETYEGYYEIWEALMNFLDEYNNPEWIVYECTFSGLACGPVSYTVWYVVKSDTNFVH